MSSTKIIFFDIDGTLWDWNRQIPESTFDAVKKLKERGHKLFICSGRSRANIRSRELLDMGFDGIIAACGNHVEVGGRVIYGHVMTPEVTKLTVDTVTECGMPVVLEGPEKHWISPVGFVNDNFVDHMRATMGEYAVDLEGYTPDMTINKFSADVLPGTDYKRIKSTLSPYYDFIEYGVLPDITGTDEGDDPFRILSVIEAVPVGSSKGRGIRLITGELGLDETESYAVGDSANDIEMLRSVDHGIAMGNGSDALKAVAEYITTDIHEDGIYNAMRHYGLI